MKDYIMRLSTLASSLALAGALAAGGFMLTPSFASENRGAPAAERQWLSIPQIHEKLEAAGYRHVEKVERERGGYEVRATDRNGERVKLYVNPQTGEVLDRRGSGARARSDDDRRWRDSADCTKRRCRDDLPQATTAPGPAGK